MFEHVGHKNYKKYMEIVYNNLKPGGLFLLHTIGSARFRGGTDKWIEKYIFPNGILPSAKQIIDANKARFILPDWHNFGHDYDKTLMAWHKKIQKNWDKIKNNYPNRFKRMWEYYLLCCAGAFRSGSIQLWQIVFSKGDVPEGYLSIR
jgi:cyclopropane-fatty-acyl-phospholipid synthase